MKGVKIELDKNLERDWWETNRRSDVQIIENRGLLYVHHKPSSDRSKIAVYNDDSFIKFVGANSPKALLKFIETHGYLFNPDMIRKGDFSFEGDRVAPSVDDVRSAFSVFDWSVNKKRQVTQDAMAISQAYDPSWGGIVNVSYEYLGDWIAARSVILKYLELHELGFLGVKKNECPKFSISVANAPLYKRFLKPHVNRYRSSKAKDVSGKTGFWIEGDELCLYVPFGSVSRVMDYLVNMHIQGGTRFNAENGMLHLSFTHLLSVIWYQMVEQLDTRVVVKHCKNCGAIMLDTIHGKKKRACCESCRQALYTSEHPKKKANPAH